MATYIICGSADSQELPECQALGELLEKNTSGVKVRSIMKHGTEWKEFLQKTKHSYGFKESSNPLIFTLEGKHIGNASAFQNQIRNVYGLRVLLTKEEIDRRLRENIDVANQEYKEKHVGVDLHEKIASKRAETMKEGSIKQIGGLFREIIEEGSVRFLVKESDIMPYNDIRPKEEVLEPIETENFEEFQSNYIRYLEEQGIQKKKEADREQRKIQAEKERIEREAQEAARHAEAEAQGTGEGVGNQGEVTGEGGDNRGSGSGEGDNQGEGVDNQGTGAQGENLTQEENLDTIKTIEDPQPPTSTTQEEGKKEGDQIQPPLIIGGSPSMDNIPLDHTTSFVHDLPPPFQVTLPHNLLIHQYESKYGLFMHPHQLIEGELLLARGEEKEGKWTVCDYTHNHPRLLKRIKRSAAGERSEDPMPSDNVDLEEKEEEEELLWQKYDTDICQPLLHDEWALWQQIVYDIHGIGYFSLLPVGKHSELTMQHQQLCILPMPHQYLGSSLPIETALSQSYNKTRLEKLGEITELENMDPDAEKIHQIKILREDLENMLFQIDHYKFPHICVKFDNLMKTRSDNEIEKMYERCIEYLDLKPSISRCGVNVIFCKEWMMVCEFEKEVSKEDWEIFLHPLAYAGVMHLPPPPENWPQTAKIRQHVLNPLQILNDAY